MNILESLIVSNERVAHICSAEYRATWKVGDTLITFGTSGNVAEGKRLILGNVSSHVMTIIKIRDDVVFARNNERTEALQLKPIGRKYWMPERGGGITAAYVVKVEDLSDEEKLFITTRRIQS